MSTDTLTPPEGFVPFTFADGYMEHIGPILWQPGEDEVKLGFFAQDYHCNPIGIVHGGLMMSVMDTAIGINITRAAENASFAPSISMTYDFVKPGQKGQWFESRVDWVQTGRKTGFASGFLIGPDGPVMRASGSCRLISPDHPGFNAPKTDRTGA